jgi:hypothetical protein
LSAQTLHPVRFRGLAQNAVLQPSK